MAMRSSSSLRVGQALVDGQAAVHVGAVVGRQQGRGVQVDLTGQVEGRVQVGLLARLERAHGFVEHLVVHREAHFLDVARLRIAQDLAGAADLQVVHGEVEARSPALPWPGWPPGASWRWP